MTPFLEVHINIDPVFLEPTPNNPFFSTKSYIECPLYFSSPVGTCTSLSYSSAPGPIAERKANISQSHMPLKDSLCFIVFANILIKLMKIGKMCSLKVIFNSILVFANIFPIFCE